MGSIDKFGHVSVSKRETIKVNTNSSNNLTLDSDGHYNAQNKRIKLLHDPIEKTDAVTKQWVQKNSVQFLKDSVSLGNKRLTDLAPPNVRSDAISKGYVEGRLLVFSDNNNGFNFSGKRLSNVGNPIDRFDVVTLNAMDWKYQTLKEDIQKEIKDKTESLFSSFDEKLSTVKTELNSITNLLRNLAEKTSPGVDSRKKNEQRGSGERAP